MLTRVGRKIIPDKALLAGTAFLALFGLVMQYSASSYAALNETGDRKSVV